MAGYYDKRKYDECNVNEINNENTQQSNYHLYPGYGINLSYPNNDENNCLGYPGTFQHNLFGNNINDIGVRSEIESLLQWRTEYNNLKVNKVDDTRIGLTKEYNEKCSKNKNGLNLLKEKEKLLKTNNINLCHRSQETLNSRLNEIENREKKLNRDTFENKNIQNFIYNGIDGLEQYNNNRFGVNTRLQGKMQIENLVKKNKKKTTC